MKKVLLDELMPDYDFREVHATEVSVAVRKLDGVPGWLLDQDMVASPLRL